jgi:hypothetical protein
MAIGTSLTGCELLTADYGALLPEDGNGLRLPPGFSSRIVATTGSEVPGTAHTWHPAPSGGSCFATSDGGWIYVSSADVADGGGGVGMIRFDARGSIVDAHSILTGTSRSSTGGPTPWGTWLSCERIDTGLVWECDPHGLAPAIELPTLGRFRHQAAAVDPVLGHVYLAEDRPDGGLYRYVPLGYPDLSAGELQVMTEVDGTIDWVPVPDPSGDPVPVRHQVPSTRRFDVGDGLWMRGRRLVLSTRGDSRIWAYLPDLGILGGVYDDDTSPTPVLTGPDDITQPPEPGADHVFVVEGNGSMRLVAVDSERGGEHATLFCELTGREGSQLAGPAFSPDGTRLYVSSVSHPGETFEITGPFRHRAQPWVDPLTGLDYTAMARATAGDPDSIQATIDRLAPEANATNRAVVLVPPGTYALNARLIAREGVDVRGTTGVPADVVITYEGENDVAECGGRNTLWAFMTLDYQGIYRKYAMHADRLAEPGVVNPELVLLRMRLISRRKHGAGVGSRQDQQLFAYDTEFRLDDAAGVTTMGAFFWHNDPGGLRPATLVLDGCTFVAEGRGRNAVDLTQYANDRGDAVYITGGSMAGGSSGVDLSIVSSPSGPQSWVDFAVDPDLYDSCNVTDALTFRPCGGLTIPGPTRMPLRTS